MKKIVTMPRKFLYEASSGPIKGYYSQAQLRRFGLTTEEIRELPSRTHSELLLETIKNRYAIKQPLKGSEVTEQKEDTNETNGNKS